MSRYENLQRITALAPDFSSGYQEVCQLIDAWSFGRYQVLLLLLCSAGYFAVCADLLLIVYIEPSLEASFGMSNMDFAFLNFATCMSSNAGAVVFGYLSDRNGRRTPFILSATIAALFGIGSMLSNSYWLLMALRTAVGFGLGGLASIDFLIFNEMCPKRVRGKATLVITVFGALGVLLMAGLNLVPWNEYLPTSEKWRFMIFIGALPMLVVCIARAFLIDESPKHLVSVERYSETIEVLKKIARWNRERFAPEADTPTLHRLSLESSSDLDISLDDIAKPCIVTRFLWHPLKAYGSVVAYNPKLAVCLFSCWLFQGLANWGLTLFLPEYLTSKGAISADLTIFLMVACELPGLLLAFCLVDVPFIGRLNLMRSLFLLAALSSLATAFIHQQLLIVVSCCAIYFFMIPNWGVLYTYSSEVYPTEMRSTANGLFQLHSLLGGMFSPFLSGKLVDKFTANNGSQSEVDCYMLAWTSCLFVGFISSLLLRKETLTISL